MVFRSFITAPSGYARTAGLLYRVIGSRQLPAIIGYGLTAAGVVYLAGSMIRFRAPGRVADFAPIYAVPLLAELALCLWLLLTGSPARNPTGHPDILPSP